jgi:hypothetical protein
MLEGLASSRVERPAGLIVGEFEAAKNMFDKAGDYWTKAIRLAPNNYIEAQNWLKITGKLTNNIG